VSGHPVNLVLFRATVFSFRLLAVCV